MPEGRNVRDKVQSKLQSNFKQEPTRLKSVATKHFVRRTQCFLQNALPFLLRMHDHGFRDAILAFFRPDGENVKLRGKNACIRGKNSFRT